MVKGAIKPSGSSTGPSTSTSQQLPTNITAGQNPADPLTQLNSSQVFGHPGLAGLNSGAQATSGGFNPFAAMGMPGEWDGVVFWCGWVLGGVGLGWPVCLLLKMSSSSSTLYEKPERPQA